MISCIRLGSTSIKSEEHGRSVVIKCPVKVKMEMVYVYHFSLRLTLKSKPKFNLNKIKNSQNSLIPKRTVHVLVESSSSRSDSNASDEEG